MSLWDKLIGRKQAGDTPGFFDHHREWEEGWWEGLTPNLRDSLRGWETEQSYLVSERQVQGADVQPGEMILFSLNEHLSLPGPRGGESTIPYAGGAFISRADDLYESIYGRAMPAVLTDSEKRHMLSEHRRRIRSGEFWRERRMNRQEYLWGRQDADVQTEFYTAQEGPGATRLGGYQGYLRGLGRYGAWAENESFDDFLKRLDPYNRYTFRRHATDQVDLLEYQHLAGRQKMSRVEEEARGWPEYRGQSYAEARDFLEPYSYNAAVTGWRRTLLDVTTIGKGVEFASWLRQEGVSVFSVLDPFRHIPYWASKFWSDEQLMDWADRTPWAKGWGGAMSFLSTVDDIEDMLGFAGVNLWGFTGWYIMHPDQIVNRALVMPDSFKEAFYPSEQKLFEPPWGEDGALPWLYSHWMQLTAWGLGVRALWRNTALSWPKRKVVWQPFKEVRLGTIMSLGLRLESTVDLQKPQGKGFWRRGFQDLRTQQRALRELGQLREVMSESSEVAELHAGQWLTTADIVAKMQQRPLMGMFQALDPFTRRANLNPLGGVGQLELLDPENLPKEMTWSTGMWRLLVPRMAGYFEGSKVGWWHVGGVPQALRDARKGVLKKWGEIDTEIRAGLEDYLEHYPDRQPPVFGQDAYFRRIVGGWLRDRGREIWNIARRLPGLSGLVSGVEALRMQERRLVELYGLGVEQLAGSVKELLADRPEWGERGLRYVGRWVDAMPVLRGDTTVHETALQQLAGSDFTRQASGIQGDILRLQGRVGMGARAVYGLFRRMGWVSGDHLFDLRITDRNWALGWLGVAQGQVRLESITDLQAETETPGYHFYDPMIRAGRRIMTILGDEGMDIEKPPSLPLMDRLLARLPRVAAYVDMGKELRAERVRSEGRSFGVGTSYRGEDQNPFSLRRNLIPWLAEEYRALRLFQRRALEMEHIHASVSTGVPEGKEYSRVWGSMEEMRQRRHFRLISLLEPLARRFDFGRADLLYGQKVPQSEWYASTHPEATDADRRIMRANYRRVVLGDWPQYAHMIRGGMRRHRVKLPFTKMGDAFRWFGNNMPPEFRGGGGMWGDFRYLWRGMGDLRAVQRAKIDIGILADEIVGYMEGDAWRELQVAEREIQWLKESKRGLVTLSDDKEMISLAWAEQSKIDVQRKELRLLGDRVVRMQEDVSVYRDVPVRNSFEKLFKQFFPEEFEVYHTRMEAGTTESFAELTRMAMLRHIERDLGVSRVSESNFLREARAWLPMVVDVHGAVFKFGGVSGGEWTGEWSVADLQRDVHRLGQLDTDAFGQFLEATYDWYDALESTEEVSQTNWRWTGSGLEKVGSLDRGDDVWFERDLIRIAKSFRGAHLFESMASENATYLLKVRDIMKGLVGEDPLLPFGISWQGEGFSRYGSQSVGPLQELISRVTREIAEQSDLPAQGAWVVSESGFRGVDPWSVADILEGLGIEDPYSGLEREGDRFYRYVRDAAGEEKRVRADVGTLKQSMLDRILLEIESPGEYVPTVDMEELERQKSQVLEMFENQAKSNAAEMENIENQLRNIEFERDLLTRMGGDADALAESLGELGAREGDLLRSQEGIRALHSGLEDEVELALREVELSAGREMDLMADVRAKSFWDMLSIWSRQTGEDLSGDLGIFWQVSEQRFFRLDRDAEGLQEAVEVDLDEIKMNLLERMKNRIGIWEVPLRVGEVDELGVLQAMLRDWSYVEDLSPGILQDGKFWRYVEDPSSGILQEGRFLRPGLEGVLEDAKVEPSEIVDSLLRSFSRELSRPVPPDAAVLESMTGILRGLNVDVSADLREQVSTEEVVDILRQAVSGQLAIPFEGTDVPGKVKMYERVRSVKRVAERMLRLGTEPELGMDKGFTRRLRERIRELGISDYLFYGSSSRTESSERLMTFAEDLRDLGLRQLEASNIETFEQVEAMVRRELAELPPSGVPQVLRDLVAAGPELPADAKPIYRRERTGLSGKTWREGIAPKAFDAALERGENIIDAYGGPKADMVRMMNQLLAFVEEMEASDRVKVARKYERFLRSIPGLSRADMLYRPIFQMYMRELKFKKWDWDEKSKTDAPNVLRSHGWSAEWMLNPLTRLRELTGVRVPGEGINVVKPLWQRLQAWRVEIGRRAPSSSVWDRLASPMIARGIAQANLGEREINGKPLRELLPDLEWRKMARLGEYGDMEVPGRSPRVTGGFLARGWEVARPRVIGGALVAGAGLAAGLGALGKKGFSGPWNARPWTFLLGLSSLAFIAGGAFFFGSDPEGKRAWNRRLLGIPGRLGLVPDEPTVDISRMESGDVLWGRATVHPLYSKKVVGLTLEDVEYIDMPGDEAAPYRLMIGGAFDRLERGRRFPPWAGQFGSYSVDAIRFAPLLPSSRVDMSGVDLLDPLWGIEIAEEEAGIPYDRSLYPYPPSLEALLQARDGGLLDVYTGEVIPHKRLADIEHVVSLSEAHASGLWRADEGVRRMFAADLANLALASEEINRIFKVGKDAAEWLPETREAQLWYAQTVVNVKRRYGLSVDAAEADILRRILQGEFITRDEVLSGELTPAEQVGIEPGSGRMLTREEWSVFGLDQVGGLEEAAVTDDGTLVVWGPGWGVDYGALPPGTLVPEGLPFPFLGNWAKEKSARFWKRKHDPDDEVSILEYFLATSPEVWEKPTGEETRRWWRTDWSPHPDQHWAVTAAQGVGRFVLHHALSLLSFLPTTRVVGYGLDAADLLGYNLRFRTERQRAAQEWGLRRALEKKEPTAVELRWAEVEARLGRKLFATEVDDPWGAVWNMLGAGWSKHRAAQRAARVEEPIARLRAWLAQDDAPASGFTASGFRIREDVPILPRMDSVYLPFVAGPQDVGEVVEEEEKQGWAASLWGHTKDALRNFLPRRVDLRKHAREREQNLLGYEREYRTYLPLLVRDGDPIGRMVDVMVGFQMPAAAVGVPGPPTKEEVEAMIREAVPVVVRQVKEDAKPAVRQQEVEGDADDLKLERKVREIFGRMIRMSAESQNTPLLY